MPSVFSYLQQQPFLAFSCSSSPSSQFLRTSWKWDLMGLPLLWLFWDYWDQMFFSWEPDQRKWERVKTRTLRKATESEDKAGEEWFLVCNTAAQSIFFALLAPCQHFADVSVPLQCEKLDNFLTKPFSEPRATWMSVVLSELSCPNSHKQAPGFNVGFLADLTIPLFPEILSILIAFSCWGHLLARTQLNRLLILPNLW